jgi:hypothetical protein
VTEADNNLMMLLLLLSAFLMDPQGVNGLLQQDMAFAKAANEIPLTQERTQAWGEEEAVTESPPRLKRNQHVVVAIFDSRRVVLVVANWVRPFVVAFVWSCHCCCCCSMK